MENFFRIKESYYKKLLDMFIEMFDDNKENMRSYLYYGHTVGNNVWNDYYTIIFINEFNEEDDTMRALEHIVDEIVGNEIDTNFTLGGLTVHKSKRGFTVRFNFGDDKKLSYSMHNRRSKHLYAYMELSTGAYFPKESLKNVLWHKFDDDTYIRKIKFDPEKSRIELELYNNVNMLIEASRLFDYE